MQYFNNLNKRCIMWSIHDKCQGMSGSLPDLELPPIALPLSLFPPLFTTFIIKSNCA